MATSDLRDFVVWRETGDDEPDGRRPDKASRVTAPVVAFARWERREKEEGPTFLNTATILSSPAQPLPRCTQ